MKKIFSVIGILASLSAAEGLHRIGGFVSAMNGGDTPFYMVALCVSLVACLLFVLSMVGKLSRLLKWIAVICLVASAGVMMLAPAFPVIMQIIVSLIVAAVCMAFAPITPATVSVVTDGANPTESASKPSMFKRVAIAVVIVLILLAVLGKITVPTKPQTDTQSQQTHEKTN